MRVRVYPRLTDACCSRAPKSTHSSSPSPPWRSSAPPLPCPSEVAPSLPRSSSPAAAAPTRDAAPASTDGCFLGRVEKMALTSPILRTREWEEGERNGSAKSLVMESAFARKRRVPVFPRRLLADWRIYAYDYEDLERGRIADGEEQSRGLPLLASQLSRCRGVGDDWSSSLPLHALSSFKGKDCKKQASLRKPPSSPLPNPLRQSDPLRSRRRSSSLDDPQLHRTRRLRLGSIKS